MTKGLRWGRTWIALAVLAALVLPVCTGCSQKETKMETSIFAMDTVMNLTFYGDDSEASLKGVQEELVEEIYSLEDKLSTTKEESELYALNEQGQASLSPETAELLTKALELCETTQGALDIIEFEKGHPTFDELYPLIRGTVTRAAYEQDDPQAAQIAMGQVLGRIHDVKPAAQIIRDMVDECRQMHRRVSGLLGLP